MAIYAQKIAQDLRDQLRAYDDFIGLYLYGSQASGVAKPESDIDIVALFANDKDEDENIIMPAWKMEVENDIIIDFHPYTPEQLQRDNYYFAEVNKGIYYAR